MSDQGPTPPTPMEDAALALYYHAAQLIKEGKSQDAIIRELVRRGVREDTARTMLDRLDQSRTKVARRYGYRNIAVGLVLIVVALLPLFGIIAEKATGATFIVAVVMLAAGFIVLGRGLLQIRVVQLPHD